MDKAHFREYFQFTRNERIAIILLLVLVVITSAIPAFLKNGTMEPHPSLALYEEGIKQLEDISRRPVLENVDEQEVFSGRPATTHKSPDFSLFLFDPNTISEAGWKKLGVRAKTITTIRNYLTKGGRFRKPEDLNKVYGLNEKEVKRLLPYVRIVPDQNRNAFESAKGKSERKFSERNTNFPPPLAIDINEADTSLFIQLPGIGSKLAQRIINFRGKLGGFYSVDQVGETFGLADSVFQKIKSRLLCGEIATKKININSATTSDLTRHPYINWKLSNAIVQFRTQHGHFTSLSELGQIQLLDQGQLAKLLPYLSVE